MIGSYPSEVVRTVAALVTPFIMLFGLYVTTHGHYGPGGGFAGGVLLAVGPVLLRLTYAPAATHRVFPSTAVLMVALAGFGAFVLIGLVPVAAGGAFLDYAAVPVSEVAASKLRSYGSLIVEIAVGLAVFGTILSIFDAITGDQP
jgi:multicomponent Na+:H+ antiporter subunit B